MRLRKLTLRHFRNVGFATLELSGRRQFLAGRNGQGKTNLLEAAGFVTALRSFRTTDNKLLVSHGQHSAALAYEVEHEREGVAHVNLTLRPDGKELWCDHARVTKLADYLGRFPTVVFSSQDLQLVRGSPAGRRRWMDLTLAAMDAGYLRALQTATRALAERNALLKSGRGSEAELAAFEATLAPAAAELIARRADGLAAIGRGLVAAYARLTDDQEPVGIQYEPDFTEPSAEALQARLEAGRERDRQFRTTLVGPHRDDVLFRVRHTPARDYGSEGQQRSFVLALRLAQAAWFQEKCGVRPVLLADDVLGELDPERRARFWRAVDPESQIVATGTHLPAAENPGEGSFESWQVFEVVDGAFTVKGSV
jgi:DNA replication and repair protein RecF